jgi:hypothetical protein
MSAPTAEQVQELLDGARAYAEAEDRYHAQCMRLDVERDVENVKGEDWDEATNIACKTVNDAAAKLHAICERLFPETKAERDAAWRVYEAHFFGPPRSHP